MTQTQAGRATITQLHRITGVAESTWRRWLDNPDCTLTAQDGKPYGATSKKHGHETPGRQRWIDLQDARKFLEDRGIHTWDESQIPAATVASLQAEVDELKGKLGALDELKRQVGTLREQLDTLRLQPSRLYASAPPVSAAPLAASSPPLATSYHPRRDSDDTATLRYTSPRPSSAAGLGASGAVDMPPMRSPKTTRPLDDAARIRALREKQIRWVPEEMQSWYKGSEVAQLIFGGTHWHVCCQMAARGYVMFAPFGRMCGLTDKQIEVDRMKEYMWLKHRRAPDRRYYFVRIQPKPGEDSDQGLRFLGPEQRRLWRDRWANIGTLTNIERGSEATTLKGLQEYGAFSYLAKLDSFVLDQIRALDPVAVHATDQ